MTNRRRRGAGPNPKAGGSKKNNRSRKSQKKRQRSFWGDVAIAEREESPVRITRDPSAIVRSLGSPPLSGHETVAEHYFDAVYDRSVGLAGALAAAANLLEDEPDPTAVGERE